MKQRSLASHLAVWSFAFALVLKAAVPAMASWAAELQGRPIADVCDVYGVATVPIAGTASMVSLPVHHHHAGMSMAGVEGAHDGIDASAGDGTGAPMHHGGHDQHHGSDHCALSAVIALSTAGFGAYVAPVLAQRDRTIALAPHAPAIADAAARWVALLGHGPPSLL